MPVPNINDWYEDWRPNGEVTDQEAMDQRIPWIINRSDEIEWGVPGTHHGYNWGHDTWKNWKGSIQGGITYVYPPDRQYWDGETPQSMQARVNREYAYKDFKQSNTALPEVVEGKTLGYQQWEDREVFWKNRRPFVYSKNANRIYLGKPGLYHVDVEQEFGLPVIRADSRHNMWRGITYEHDGQLVVQIFANFAPAEETIQINQLVKEALAQHFNLPVMPDEQATDTTWNLAKTGTAWAWPIPDEWALQHTDRHGEEIGITPEQTEAVVHRFDAITSEQQPEIDGEIEDQMDNLWHNGWEWKFVIERGDEALVSGCGETGMYNGWNTHAELWDELEGDQPNHNVDALGFIIKPAMKSGDHPFKVQVMSGHQLPDAQILQLLGLTLNDAVIERRGIEGTFGTEWEDDEVPEHWGKVFDWAEENTKTAKPGKNYCWFNCGKRAKHWVIQGMNMFGLCDDHINEQQIPSLDDIQNQSLETEKMRHMITAGEEEDIPAEPGETPIPDGYVRLYHYSTGEPEVIKREGLRIDLAKGENYGEPNRIWASTQYPRNAEKVVAEFAVPVLDSRWDIGKYQDGIKYDDGYGAEAYIDYITKRGANVTFYDSIAPSEIIAVHEPWHAHYRYMVNNALNVGEYGWLEDSTDLPDHQRAFQLYKQRLGNAPYEVIQGQFDPAEDVWKMDRRPGYVMDGRIYIGQPGAYHADVRNEFELTGDNSDSTWIEVWDEGFITTSSSFDRQEKTNIAQSLTEYLGFPIYISRIEQPGDNNWRLGTPQAWRPPVNYRFVPFTDFELSGWKDADQMEKQQWTQRAERMNGRAMKAGVRGRVRARELWALNKRFEGTCAYCHQALSWGTEDATLDHAVPLALGGTGDIANLVPACRRDNQELNKWDRRNNPQEMVKEDYYVPEEFAGGEKIADTRSDTWEEDREREEEERLKSIEEGRIPDLEDWFIDWEGDYAMEQYRVPWVINRNEIGELKIEYGDQGTHHDDNWDLDEYEPDMWGSAQGDQVYVYNAGGENPTAIQQWVMSDMKEKGIRTSATNNVIEHVTPPMVLEESKWDVRRPYLYDHANDILHIGSPGSSHFRLTKDAVTEWYRQNDMEEFADALSYYESRTAFIEGAFLDRPDRPNAVRAWDETTAALVDEFGPRIEQLVGSPIIPDMDPDYLPDMMPDPTPINDTEWEPQL